MPPDIDELPAALSTTEAAELLGVSRGAVWAAARDEGGVIVNGELIRPHRVGRALRWPKASLLAHAEPTESAGIDRAAVATALTEVAMTKRLAVQLVEQLAETERRLSATAMATTSPRATARDCHSNDERPQHEAAGADVQEDPHRVDQVNGDGTD